MKKIFILIAIITLLKITTGVDSSAGRSTETVDTSAYNVPVIVPQFTELDGNLFLALDLQDSLVLSDGDIVEFNFGRNNKLISFHVNDINQEIIDSGNANVFVMIPQDLAIELKNERLSSIRIKSSEKEVVVPVNQRWQPDQYIVSL